MRKAVMTGLLACAILPVINSESASAAPLEIFNTNTATLPKIEFALEQKDLVRVVSIVSESEEATTLPEEAPEETAELTHLVTKGQSLAEIAKNYDTTWERIYAKNLDIENPDVIEVGQELVIPNQNEELDLREFEFVAPEPIATRTTSASATAQPIATYRGSSAGNTYVRGQCTWYAKSRRPDLPNNLGNARTWVSRAAAQGIATGSVPRVGAIAARGNHVAYVESVNGDGTITVTDMNWSGPYEITRRTVAASTMRYIY